jgi:hypothetical protein
MGKSGDELSARRFAYGTVRSSIASAEGARLVKDCRCRLSEAETTIAEDVNKDPLSIASTADTSFTDGNNGTKPQEFVPPK